MATQADYLRVLRSGPMPVTQLFANVYPAMEKPQGASNWTLDRLIATDQVWVVRLGWEKKDRDPMRRRARTWVMLKETGQQLLDHGVIQQVPVHAAYGGTPHYWTTRFTLAPGRSFSSCFLCGGHETEGLRRTPNGTLHRECENQFAHNYQESI